MVGYSRQMGRDESGTLARLKTYRGELFEPALARNGGRLVKLTGDGALAAFGSAVDSLRAAIEFQQAVAEANLARPEGDRIVFRIGLHLGDLIVDGDDLYGDGVNIAARLESQAPVGGILVSGTIHDAVAGKLKTQLHELGPLPLKNIERPVLTFRADWLGEDWLPPTSASSSASALDAIPQKSNPPRLSVVVLPFANIGGDPEQEYFVDGVTESLTTDLSRMAGMLVIGCNTAFTYKGKHVDLKEVGHELGVRYVLEGSVQRGGNRMRVNPMPPPLNVRCSPLSDPTTTVCTIEVRLGPGETIQGSVEFASCRNQRANASIHVSTADDTVTADHSVALHRGC